MKNPIPVVVALGELLWDIFPEGAKFGGAPGNFAHHVASLGAQTFMVSAVGDDDLGRVALERLQNSGIDISHVVVDDTHPTGSVDVSIDRRGQGAFRFHEDESWDFLAWSDDLQRLANRCDAVCFGTLGQRSDQSRATIRRFVETTKKTALRIFDINLRAPFYTIDVVTETLKLANVLKLNDDELRWMAETLGLRQGPEIDQAIEIRQRFELKLVAVTRGERGALVVTEESTHDVAGHPVDVRDTVGAGDAFTAALTIGLIQGKEIGALAETACRIAEYVCTQSGATPALPESLCREFRI